MTTCDNVTLTGVLLATTCTKRGAICPTCGAITVADRGARVGSLTLPIDHTPKGNRP